MASAANAQKQNINAIIVTFKTSVGNQLNNSFWAFKKKFVEMKKFKNDKRKIIHLDADLYTSTLYVLTSLHPYLNKGDILFFDEFAVPRHEFLAFKNYTESYRVSYEVIGTMNNYFFTAIKIV